MTRPDPDETPEAAPPPTITHLHVGEDAADSESELRPSYGAPEERYRIRQPIGSGNMGEVFEAGDRLLDRNVAIKYMRGERQPGTFYGEARTSSRLNHPNIPPVYDLGVDSRGRPFYVMQLIEGQSLSEILSDRRQWSLPRLLSLFQQVCAAIEFAHDAGVLHLDIKPANVMVGRYGELYVVDWGLSTETNAPVEGIRGTPAYMSPEQAQGRESLDRASDVFALGSVLYEVCTGQRAFPGRSVPEVMALVETAEFDRGATWDAIPEELREIIGEALQLDPTRRPNARALAANVQEFLDGTKEQARRRAAAEGAMAVATERLREREALLERAVELARTVEQSRPDAGSSLEDRQKHWQVEDELRSVRADAEIVLERATESMLEAYRAAPEVPEVRDQLSQLYWDRFCEAEDRDEQFKLLFFESQLRRLNVPSYVARLEGRGDLVCSCDPPPDSAKIYQLREVDRILVADHERTIEIAQPLRSEPLPTGTYELRLQKSQHREVRLPFVISREKRTELAVRFHRDVGVGSDFALIPGGECTLGDDDDESLPRQRKVLPDFCIGRYPITWRDYRDYLQARLDSGQDVTPWLPTQTTLGEPVWRVAHGRVLFHENPARETERLDWPIFSVTYDHAQEYCRWRGERDGRRYDLPTDEEWEKAARGVDGRRYPWGDQFDASLCKNAASTVEKSQPAPIGSFPTDCSPYGVRDMAGGVRDWCSSWFDERNDLRSVRGGAWNFGKLAARCSYRIGCPPGDSYAFIGFRLVHRFD